MTTEELAEYWSQLDDEASELQPLLAQPENDGMRNALTVVAAVMATGLVVSVFLPKHVLEA